MAHRTNDGKQLACKVVDMSSVKKGAAAGWTDPRLSNFLGKNNQLVAVRENNHREEDANARIEVYEREVKLLAGLRHVSL